jgi:single-strand DNA-binding protein
MKNLVQIEGNLGQDPVHTQLSSGKHVTRLSIAVNKTWTKGKEKKQTTDRFRVECWDKLPQPASRLKKADAVFVQGELRTSEYVKDGVTIPAVSIVAGHLRKIDFSIFSKADTAEAAANSSEAPEQQELTTNSKNLAAIPLTCE